MPQTDNGQQGLKLSKMSNTGQRETMTDPTKIVSHQKNAFMRAHRQTLL